MSRKGNEGPESVSSDESAGIITFPAFEPDQVDLSQVSAPQNQVGREINEIRADPKGGYGDVAAVAGGRERAKALKQSIEQMEVAQLLMGPVEEAHDDRVTELANQLDDIFHQCALLANLASSRRELPVVEKIARGDMERARGNSGIIQFPLNASRAKAA